MATFLNRMEDCRVTLVDFDLIESKNRKRQWGGKKNIGVSKVRMASEVLGVLCDSPIAIQGVMVDTPEDLMDFVRVDIERYARNTMVPGQSLTEEDVKRLTEEYKKAIQELIVVCLPDNHLCRVLTHEGCKLLAEQLEVPVHEVVAGNGPDYGWAYGCTHYFFSKKKVVEEIMGKAAKRKGPLGWYYCMGDWTKLHRDIVEEAEKERELLAQPASCGAMEEDVPGQTSHTNLMTAVCIWDMVSILAEENKYVGEVYWVVESDPKDESRKQTTFKAKLAEVKWSQA